MSASARLTATQVAHDVVGLLEGTLTALAADVKDRKLPYRWRTGATQPRYESEVRLRVTYDVLTMILEAESGEVARAWMIGVNPRLGDVQPVMAIREGRYPEVLAAARAFVDDGQMP